ncbi:MAG: hypothetical protein ACI9O6_001069 [Glaciecola sp.]|jgi:hypothetical protein
MASKELTEGRLREALHRLLEGKPQRLKKVGKLSLNKINNEAGLGHSYIHKFPDFVRDVANPAIKKYNENYDPQVAELLSEKVELSDTEKFRVKLKKEKGLKDDYRSELNEVKAMNKALEELNSSLMFRIYDLQEELRRSKVVSIKGRNQN